MDEYFTNPGIILLEHESVGESTLLLKDRANISNSIYLNNLEMLAARQREERLEKLVIYDRIVEKFFHHSKPDVR